MVEIWDRALRVIPVIGRGYSGDPRAQHSDVTGGVRMPERNTSGAHDHHVRGHPCNPAHTGGDGRGLHWVIVASKSDAG